VFLFGSAKIGRSKIFNFTTQSLLTRVVEEMEPKAVEAQELRLLVVIRRMQRTPLVPPPRGLLPTPPGVKAIAQPFHSLCAGMASRRASYPPVVRLMAFSSRVVPQTPSPAPPAHPLAVDCVCGTTLET